jgi:hypothetical protein
MAHKAPLVVPALKRHTATVIVAHGLGDSGAGWYGMARSFAVEAYTKTAQDLSGRELAQKKQV